MVALRGFGQRPGAGAGPIHRQDLMTRVARTVLEGGGRVRDGQQPASHTIMLTTQRYSEGDTDAERGLMHLV